MAHGKCECDFHSALEFIGVSHISVDVWEDGVAAPRRHQKTKGQWKCEPIRREEVGYRWLTEGSWCVRLDEAVDKNYGYD